MPAREILRTVGRDLAPGAGRVRKTTAGARALLLVAAAVAVAGSGGCTQLDDTLARVPFFAFMRSSPSFDPYEAPRPAPEHALPYESPAGEVYPAIEPTDAGLRAFAATVSNPAPMNDSVLARGREMFDRYCMVCHGPEGRGRETGPVTATGAYPPIAPDLATGPATGYPDGYIYGIMRVGRGLMPSYGARVVDGDRWAIVDYVRLLEQQAAAQDSAQAAGDSAAAPAGAAPTGGSGEGS